jgi:Ras-related protein Rab-23
MLEQDMEVSLKVIIVGNGKVGKTSMLTRFAKGLMTEQYKKTIGTDFMEKEIVLGSSGETVRLMLWDTAGQEMFAGLTRNYYRGSGAVVYVFSTIDHESFTQITRWKDKVENECGELVSVLVQNKVDLLDEAKVTSEEAENLAKELGMKLYRTSVKDNLHVNEVFEHVAEQYIKRGGESSIDTALPGLGGSGQSADPNPQNVDFKPSTQRTGGRKAFCSIL